MVRRVVGFVAGLVCAACGGSEDAAAPGADAGVDQAGGASGSAGSGGSAGTGGSAGSGGTGGSGGTAGAAGGALAGDALVYAETIPNGYHLSGTFYSWQAGPRCTYEDVGPCRIDRCVVAGTRADAGEVTLGMGAQRRVIPAIEVGVYELSGTGVLWQPGDSLRFAVAGAAVPAHEQTVIVPESLTLIEPAPGASVGVSPGQGLRARWSGGANATAVVGFVGSVSGEPIVKVKCSFDAGAGEGMIPPEALADFAGEGPVGLAAFAEDYRTVEKNGWWLRVAARTLQFNATVSVE